MNEADDDNGEDHTEQPVQKKIKKGQVPPPLTKKANDVVNVVDDDVEARDEEQEDNNVDDGDKEDNALVCNDKKVSSEFPKLVISKFPHLVISNQTNFNLFPFSSQITIRKPITTMARTHQPNSRKAGLLRVMRKGKKTKAKTRKASPLLLHRLAQNQLPQKNQKKTKKNQFVMSGQEERVANRYILMELL